MPRRKRPARRATHRFPASCKTGFVSIATRTWPSDIAALSGFHGKEPAVTGVECSACHTEHEGRDHDILGLDPDTFDHDFSNFPLLGKHAEAMCVDCHVEEHETYHAAETECNACHRDDDVHRGNLGVACTDCHSETAWTDTHFDHELTSEYALTGKHAEITCVSCHVDEVYQDTPETCVGCHAADDSHEGNNGTECQECHTTSQLAGDFVRSLRAQRFCVARRP